jgi:hypothetical protein
VRFRIHKDENRGRLGAVDVHPIFCEPFVGDSKEYREISVVDRFIEADTESLAGFLRRESGEDLYFGWKNIDPAFKNRRNVLRVGDPVWHGIRTHTNGKFEASHIAIYSRAEIDRMAQGLQPYELKSDPEPVAIEPQSKLLHPKNCRRTLLELIQQRRAK